jgi:hypothetical protein
MATAVLVVMTSICCVAQVPVTGQSRFFILDIFSQDQIVMEKIDLGDVADGEKVRFALLIRNHRHSAMELKDIDIGMREFEIDNPITIQAGDSGLLLGSLKVDCSKNGTKERRQLSFKTAKEGTLILSFSCNLKGVAIFKDKVASFSLKQSELTRPEVSIRIPLVISRDQEISRIKLSTDEGLGFIKLKPTQVGDEVFAVASFNPGFLEDKNIRGSFFIENAGRSTKSSIRISLRKVDDLLVLPDRIVFRWDVDGVRLVGEGIIRCENAVCEIDELRVDCSFSGKSKVECSVAKMDSKTARCYFSILPENDELVQLKSGRIVMLATDGVTEMDTEVLIHLR